MAPPAGRTRRDGVATLVRWAMLALAIGTALAPIPVALLDIIPTYAIQRLFLAGYTPLVCFLILGYVFYIRAQLRPAPELRLDEDEDPFAEIDRSRSPRRLGAVVLNVLPAVVIAASLYCAYEYPRVLDRSMDEFVFLTTQTAMVDEPGRDADAPAAGDTARDTTPDAASRQGAARRATADTVAADDSTPVRADVRPAPVDPLMSAGVDDIPDFARLTILFIGIFAGAELAFALMAMRI